MRETANGPVRADRELDNRLIRGSALRQPTSITAVRAPRRSSRSAECGSWAPTMSWDARGLLLRLRIVDLRHAIPAYGSVLLGIARRSVPWLACRIVECGTIKWSFGRGIIDGPEKALFADLDKRTNEAMDRQEQRSRRRPHITSRVLMAPVPRACSWGWIRRCSPGWDRGRC